MTKLAIPGLIRKGSNIQRGVKRQPEKNMGQAEVVEPPRLKDKTLRADPADRRDFGDPPSDIPLESIGKAGVAAALLTRSGELNKGEEQQLAAHRASDAQDKAEGKGVHSQKVNRSGKGDNESPQAYKKDKEQGPTPKTDREDAPKASKPQVDENGKPKSKIRIAFEKAFVQARKDGLKEFEFMGKKYHTRRADGK